MLRKKTQTTVIVEVKVHANIEGNEHVGVLANLGTQLLHWTPLHSY